MCVPISSVSACQFDCVSLCVGLNVRIDGGIPLVALRSGAVATPTVKGEKRAHSPLHILRIPNRTPGEKRVHTHIAIPHHTTMPPGGAAAVKAKRSRVGSDGHSAPIVHATWKAGAASSPDLLSLRGHGGRIKGRTHQRTFTPAAVIALDNHYSERVYLMAQRTSIGRFVASVLSLSVDEVVAFPLMALLGFWFFLFGGTPTAVLAGRQCLRLFADFGALCMFEQCLKLAFRRTRPQWRPAGKKLYAMPFEWWSFPSGHAMRAAYTAVILLRPTVSQGYSPLFTTGFLEDTSVTAVVLAATWVVGVAASRVAVAKHYVVDVIVGVTLGIAVSQSPFPDFDPHGPVRIVMGVLFTLEAVVVLMVPRYREMMAAWPGLVAIVVVSWLSLPCVK